MCDAFCPPQCDRGHNRRLPQEMTPPLKVHRCSALLPVNDSWPPNSITSSILCRFAPACIRPSRRRSCFVAQSSPVLSPNASKRLCNAESLKKHKPGNPFGSSSQCCTVLIFLPLPHRRADPLLLGSTKSPKTLRLSLDDLSRASLQGRASRVTQSPVFWRGAIRQRKTLPHSAACQGFAEVPPRHPPTHAPSDQSALSVG